MAAGGFFVSSRLILSDADMRRAVLRIAHEIVEQNKGPRDLILVGIHTRGAPLAQRLGASIRSFEGEQVPVGALDIGLYRDDLQRLSASPRLRPSAIPVSVDGLTVVLVDDVLYTGRTIRAALDALTDYGRPQRIQLAVLIDRGHRELPIRADYVGKNIPTARAENVRVRLAEIDGADEVLLEAGASILRQAQDEREDLPAQDARGYPPAQDARGYPLAHGEPVEPRTTSNEHGGGSERD
jgi:pyrimidine operon attenuation protein/uracil phosphoribosyltransferase